MEKCTIHRLSMRTEDSKCYCDFNGIKICVENLGHFVNFDAPIHEDKQWTELFRTIHITSLNVKWFLEVYDSLYIDSNWHFHLILFITSWVLAEHDRAVRIEMISNSETAQWTLDFIEFGVKTKSPESIIKLEKCLKKHQFQKFDLKVFKTLNEHFPNCLSEPKPNSGPFWIQFESNFEPTIVFSPATPTWLDRSIDLKVDTCETPHEWMNDIILCFTIFAKKRPEFEIALKKVNEKDTQLIFYVRKGDPVYFSLFLGTLNNFKKIPEKTSIALLKCAVGLLPFVGSGLIIKDAVDNFKTGNPKTATCQLILGSASLVADTFLLAGPAASLVAKAAQSSPKVLKACTTVANVTSKAKTVSKVSKSVISVSKGVLQDQGSSNVRPGNRKQTSDEGLLRTVFPRLAEDILL